MRIAFVSDIHSNLPALETVLISIRKHKIDRIYCLGDIVGYGANPVECVKIIAETADKIVAGNHDWGVIGKTDFSRMSEKARLAAIWTYSQLAESDKVFLSKLPLTLHSGETFLVHSTPANPDKWEYFKSFDSPGLKKQLSVYNEQFCFLGHSHIPRIYDDTNAKIIPSDKPILLDPNRRYVINTGSVGQPRDGDPRSCYVIFDTEKKYILYKRIEYDIEKASSAILKSNLPAGLASRLFSGT